MTDDVPQHQPPAPISNVVKFPYKVSRRAFARRRRSSDNGTPEERDAKRAASASAPVVAIPPRRVLENLPWEEKREIAAQIEAKISASIESRQRASGHLKKQRDARYEAWGKAGARACFWKAMQDLDHALFVAQREKMPEALQYDPVELGSASWHATRHAYQDATDRQLLTPAPNMGCVRWKQGQKFSRLAPDRIERAIADDLAWLKRYPASERRVRRPAD